MLVLLRAVLNGLDISPRGRQAAMYFTIIFYLSICMFASGLFSDSETDFSSSFRLNYSTKTSFLMAGVRQRTSSQFTVDESDYNDSEEDSNMFWEDITRNDASAFVVWDVTNKYAGPIMTEEKFQNCLADFKDIPDVIAPLMIINSLTSNEMFLREIVNYGTTEDDLDNDQIYYEKYSRVLQDHTSYLNAVKDTLQKMDEELKQKLSCPSKTRCGCLSSQDLNKYEAEFLRLSRYGLFLKMYLIFGRSIDPAIRSFIFIPGVILNTMLIMLFVWHKELRTEPNIMILNIAVNDILILLVYLPMQYIHHYYPNTLPHEYYSNNSLFLATQTTVFSVSVFSVLTMRFQLYFEISRRLNASAPRFQISGPWRCALYVLAVWFSALAVAALTYINNNETDIGHPFAALLYTIVYVFILSIAMSALNNLILSRLKQSSQRSKQIPSSSTIVILSKAFGVTHIPLFIWLLFEGYYGVILKVLHFSSYRHFGIIIYYLNFSYACINPLALCKENSVYKTLFDRYLFSCW